MRGWLERTLAPFADFIGWRPVFGLDRVLICEDLRLAERRSLRPLGLFTMLRFVKEPGFGLRPELAQGGRLPAKARTRAVRAGLPEPLAVKIKWQVARALVHGRPCLTPIIGDPYITISQLAE